MTPATVSGRCPKPPESWDRRIRDTLRAGARALRRWADTDEELRDFGDLAELVAFVHRRDRVCEADRILFWLVCRASTDDLAARTVLACMMPGAKNLMCCYLWAHADADDSATSVLEAMWERIRTYPCERRPAKIAANIQLDTRQRISRRAAREKHRESACWCRELVHARFRGDSGQLADYEST